MRPLGFFAQVEKIIILVVASGCWLCGRLGGGSLAATKKSVVVDQQVERMGREKSTYKSSGAIAHAWAKNRLSQYASKIHQTRRAAATHTTGHTQREKSHQLAVQEAPAPPPPLIAQKTFCRRTPPKSTKLGVQQPLALLSTACSKSSSQTACGRRETPTSADPKLAMCPNPLFSTALSPAPSPAARRCRAH